MNESADQTTELYELAHTQCDGELTVAQTARLEQLVAGSVELRRHYIVYMHVHAAAEKNERGVEENDECGMMNDESPSEEWRVESGELSIQHSSFSIQHSSFNAESPIHDFSVPHSSFPILHSGPLPSFFGSVSFSYLTSAMLLGTALMVAWAWKLPENSQVAIRPQPAVAEPRQEHEPKMEFVGRITGMVDCEWSDPHTAVPGLVAVPLGRKYALASGLLEITYDTGARVILQGPATYEVESASGGYLSVGKLTARVETKAEGGGRRGEGTERVVNQKSEIANQKSLSAFRLPPSALFSVRTPTAVVTDLGTEFGVEVSEKGATTSRVFRGSVKLGLLNAGEANTNSDVVLREGQSACVESSGTNRIDMLDPSVKPAEFVREIPKRTVKAFDLVDVVAGGDGFSGRRNRGIDPTTGRISDRTPSTFYPTLAGDYLYHRVEGVALVDGVFIPNGVAGPVQVDSVGHTFDGFDKTDNLTYGHLWAGGPIALANAPDAMLTNLRGIDDYASSGHGLLLVHANSGITFDLEAIRQATGGKILRLRAVGGNAAGFAEVRTVNADLWVLVDGKPRFVRRQEAGRGGPAYVTVPLKDNDRFLTLAFTDGGDGCGWDWTILGDPQLDMVVNVPNRESDSRAKQ